MAKIQDVVFPILGTATNLVLEVLQTNMEATSATFYYKLTDGDGSIPDNGKTIVEGNISMNEQEYEDWGVDNQYCLDWAASKLGLTLIP